MTQSAYTTNSQQALHWLANLVDNDDLFYSPGEESDDDEIWLYVNDKIQASISFMDESYRVQIYNKDWYSFADPHVLIDKDTNVMTYVEAIYYDVEAYGIQEEFEEDFEMEHKRETIESPEVDRLSQEIKRIYLAGRLME